MASEEPPPSPPKSPGDAEAASPPKGKAPLRLGDLTEEATLALLFRLDMVGLATVRQVCRRLHRIASDPSLLARVSVVQWTGGLRRPLGRLRVSPQQDVRHFRTNCAELGFVQMPEEEEEAEAAGKKFLTILEWLLKGGAKPVSLQIPVSFDKDGDVLSDLTTLLTEYKVKLESLACREEHFPAFLGLLHSQPTIAHLCLNVWFSWNGYTGEDLNAAQVVEVVRSLPNLRHLTLFESHPSGDTTNLWAEPGLPIALGPQLRSVLVLETYPYEDYAMAVHTVAGIRQASAGRLLLRAVGEVDQQGDGFCYLSHLAFAVADFRAEERGRRFLVEGKLWDLWLDTAEALPKPTLDDGIIEPFLRHVARRQERERQKKDAEEERKKQEEN